MENLDNILVAQKDLILNLINDSLDCLDNGNWDNGIKGLQGALAMLRVNRQLWIEASYGYKFNELVRRIDDAQWDRSQWLHHAATVRKQQLGELYRVCKSFYVTQDQLI